MPGKELICRLTGFVEGMEGTGVATIRPRLNFLVSGWLTLLLPIETGCCLRFDLECQVGRFDDRPTCDPSPVGAVTLIRQAVPGIGFVFFVDL